MKTFLNKYLKYFILIAAVLACVFGIYRGEMVSVLNKAAKICLECCGIG